MFDIMPRCPRAPIISVIAALALCPTMTAQSPTEAAQTVIVLSPGVSTELLTANSKPRKTGEAPFEPILAEAAQRHLKAQGFTLQDPNSLPDPALAGAVAQLQPFLSRLARGAFSDEVQQALAGLAALPGDRLVFAQVMKVKEGPGGSWNSMTGQITTQMSSTVLQAALINPRTGRVLWKNEELERKVFRSSDPHFARLLENLYASLGK